MKGSSDWYRAVASLSVILPGALASAQPSFQGLGFVPGMQPFSRATAISADGSTLVGYALAQADIYRAFRWTSQTGAVSLGEILPRFPDSSSYAFDVSADGSAIVGSAFYLTCCLEREAFLWTPSGVRLLGHMPSPYIGSMAMARAISADGSIVVGHDFNSTYGEIAFMWSEATGMQPILVGERWAVDVSAGGDVVVGYYQTPTFAEAFRWTISEGTVGLGYLPGGQARSGARAVSGDGTVIVGSSHSANNVMLDQREAFRWEASSGMVGLGDLDGGEFDSTAAGVSANGAVIVGNSNGLGIEAFIWDAQHGMRNLRQLLITKYDPDVEDWHLTGATGVSADGRRICGIGTNPAGQTEAWLATVRGPCSADFNNDDALNSQDFFDYLTCFFAHGACPPGAADFNRDEIVNAQDFFDFLAAFFAGCT